MISTNRRLLARVCDVLLTSSGLEGYWDDTGPSPLAAEQRATPSDELTSSQRMVLEFAWTLWSGEGELKVADLLQETDDGALVKLGTLLVGAAYGERGVSDWLAVECGDDDRSDPGDREDPPVTH